MKTRNGFVSNSSSSSFVLVGIQLDQNSDVNEKFLQSINSELESVSDDYNCYLGLILGTNLQEQSIDFVQLDFIKQRVELLLKDYWNFTNKESEPIKIYFGAYPC